MAEEGGLVLVWINPQERPPGSQGVSRRDAHRPGTTRIVRHRVSAVGTAGASYQAMRGSSSSSGGGCASATQVWHRFEESTRGQAVRGPGRPVTAQRTPN
jgi:hypothetical protein